MSKKEETSTIKTASWTTRTFSRVANTKAVPNVQVVKNTTKPTVPTPSIDTNKKEE